MTLKQYQGAKLVVVAVLALIFSQALVLKNYFVPIAVLVVGSLLLLYLRRQVTGVLADERDWALAGRAALLSIQICSWLAVVVMFVFYARREIDPIYEAIGMTLSLTVCGIMLTYSFIFQYLRRHK
ncbi:MAG TPA: DUF2178 domain-containing protein [bacterium]|nr:DUF2178 domain-containing protein [bacterium]HPN81612.1 DUF2178 domain-containing protein [bacterium]HPW39511.1 DUF2178 domain-containing protein [bacterium]